MIILGIDPGIATAGWGVVEYKSSRFTTLGFGAITTPAKTPLPLRLNMVFEQAKKIVAEFSPTHVAIEELFFSKNVNTAFPVAQARGVLILAAAQKEVPVFEYNPMQVKQAVVGYGKAEKHQVIAMVSTILNLKTAPKLDDTADALAVAICHAHSYRGLA